MRGEAHREHRTARLRAGRARQLLAAAARANNRPAAAATAVAENKSGRSRAAHVAGGGVPEREPDFCCAEGRVGRVVGGDGVDKMFTKGTWPRHAPVAGLACRLVRKLRAATYKIPLHAFLCKQRHFLERSRCPPPPLRTWVEMQGRRAGVRAWLPVSDASVHCRTLALGRCGARTGEPHPLSEPLVCPVTRCNKNEGCVSRAGVV